MTSHQGIASVNYTLSNSKKPLSISVHCGRGSNARIIGAVIESLCEKHSPVVFIVDSTETEIRYIPKVGRLFRCWSNEKQSVYTEQFSARNLFSRICSFSEAMGNTDVIRARGEEIDFFAYRSIMNEIREKHKPFEFLSIKEEFDYTLRGTSARCVEQMVNAAQRNLKHLTVLRDAFEEALHRIEEKQSREKGYDTRYAYIREFCSCVLLPSVVKLGQDHPFTQGVFSHFSHASSDYITACDQFVTEYLTDDWNPEGN